MTSIIDTVCRSQTSLLKTSPNVLLPNINQLKSSVFIEIIIIKFYSLCTVV